MTANGPWIVMVDTANGPDGMPTYWRCPFPNRRAAVAEMSLMQRALTRLDVGRAVDMPEYDAADDVWHGSGEYPVMAFSTTTSIWLYEATDTWPRKTREEAA